MSTWDTVSRTLVAEFSDLGDAQQVTQVVVRLLVATVLGAALGWQRERHGKDAGVRTHMLVSAGAALFVLVPLQYGMGPDGLSRVIQGLLAGIGFIGAGCIIHRRSESNIQGLTTAAGIWLTAAIGVAAGMGREATAVLSTLMALGILALVPRLVRLVEKPEPLLTKADKPQDKP
jgi:putative Mg2+ transporter-C (MgtC) family protein